MLHLLLGQPLDQLRAHILPIERVRDTGASEVAIHPRTRQVRHAPKVRERRGQPCCKSRHGRTRCGPDHRHGSDGHRPPSVVGTVKPRHQAARHHLKRALRVPFEQLLKPGGAQASELRIADGVDGRGPRLTADDRHFADGFAQAELGQDHLGPVSARGDLAQAAADDDEHVGAGLAFAHDDFAAIERHQFERRFEVDQRGHIEML